MKNIVLRIVAQATLMALAVLTCIGVAWTAYGALANPLAIIVTFLGWVATGIGWQELSKYVTRRWGL